MHSLTEIRLFGSLRKSAEDPKNHRLQIDLNRSAPIIEVLKSIKIDLEDVQLTMINHKATSKNAMVHPGDRLSLFPKEYPIFADWKNLRLR